MSQLAPRGHAPHGRLDDSYSVSELRKHRPLYNFRLLDEEQEKLARLSRDQGLLASTYPQVSVTELASTGSHNNSAAGRSDRMRTARPGRGDDRKHRRGAFSGRQLMENHLRLTYGDELFDSRPYVVKGHLGIAGFPQSPIVSNSNFQALRGRILGPVPLGTFADEDSDESSESALDIESASDSVFKWCDRNNSAEDVAKKCARRAGAKNSMRRGLSKWIFLYFRVRCVSWEFMVHEEKMNYSTIDLFSDNVLDRWTVKLRFKMLIDAPMKHPLMAFLSRMGLDTDPDIVFSIDGFFGDMLVGGVRNKNSIPHRQVSFNTTPEAMGLQNGDNVFVVRANSTLRNNVEAHMQIAKRRANKTDGDDEEDDDEDIEEEEEEHH